MFKNILKGLKGIQNNDMHDYHTIVYFHTLWQKSTLRTLRLLHKQTQNFSKFKGTGQLHAITYFFHNFKWNFFFFYDDVFRKQLQIQSLLRSML